MNCVDGLCMQRVYDGYKFVVKIGYYEYSKLYLLCSYWFMKDDKV